MIKLAKGSNNVFVRLTMTEFKFLAKADPDDIPDGAGVSLTWIKTITDSVSQFQTFITQAKQRAESLASRLGDMIT